ncbi:MAG: hypothetical protein R3200_11005 [Xanthomonadales bacterium]|nr:hypothetical protein [Xanthomonadales bacterium]
MLDKEIIAQNKSRFSKEQVRELLIQSWLARPENERNQHAAERFVARAVEDFEFESEEPRTIVIRRWILPHIIRVEEKRETALGRWMNRPWFKRSQWPLRLAALALLVYAVYDIFHDLFTGSWQMAITGVPFAVLAILILIVLMVPGNHDR